MEYSLEQLHAKVENLTELVLAAVGRETLLRTIADIERNEILNELNGLRQLITTTVPGTVAQQAVRLGLVMVEPNRIGGKYFGLVLGLDYRASLVKYANSRAFEVPFTDLAVGQARLRMGDYVGIGFKEGVMSVSAADRISREPTSEKT